MPFIVPFAPSDCNLPISFLSSNLCLQALCRNIYCVSLQAHPLDGFFELPIPGEVDQYREKDFVDLRGLREREEEEVDIRVSGEWNEVLPTVMKMPEAQEVIDELHDCQAFYESELKAYLDSEYSDEALAKDWLMLRLFRTRSLNCILIDVITSSVNHVLYELRQLCITLLQPLCVILYEMFTRHWIPARPELREALRCAVNMQQPFPSIQQQAQDALLEQNDHLISLCYELLFPYYREIQEIPTLHRALAYRDSAQDEVRNCESSLPSAVQEKYYLLHKYTSKEDIQRLDSTTSV